MIPAFYWDGEDEQSLWGACVMAAVGRPLAGPVTLAPGVSCVRRLVTDDGGITRVPLAAWDPKGGVGDRGAAWVESSKRWAEANMAKGGCCR